MKFCKKYLLLITAVCLGSSVIAQEVKRVSKWRLQVNAGAAVNYFTNEQPHTGINIGFLSGIQLSYATSKHFGLYAQTGYAGAGGSLTKITDLSYLGFDPTITFANTKQSSYLLHSLASSLGFYYTVVSKQNWSFKIYAAPTLNITLGETEQYEKTGNLLTGVSGFRGVIATITGAQYVDKFKPYWWGLQTGVQFGLPLKKRNELLLNFQYNGGLTSVLDDYSYIGVAGVSGNIRTNAFTVGIGYGLPVFNKKQKTK